MVVSEQYALSVVGILFVLILIYFTKIHKVKGIHNYEHKQLKKEYDVFLEILPIEYQTKLQHIKLELTDRHIGYCKDKSTIGIYRSRGFKHEIPQRDVIFHECAHVLNDNNEHDDQFWKYYNELKMCGKDCFLF